MINLNDIHQWQRLEDGELFAFPAVRPRPVKLEVNTSGKVALYIELQGKEPAFLALVEGRETVNFVVPGPFSIMHRSPEADVYFLTADGARVHRENMDKEAYTQLHERRAVNPEIEFMRYQMEANINKRLAMQQAQFERMLADARTESAGTVDSSQPESGDGSTSPDTSVAPAGSEAGGGV